MKWSYQAMKRSYHAMKRPYRGLKRNDYLVREVFGVLIFELSLFGSPDKLGGLCI